jgi:integrase
MLKEIMTGRRLLIPVHRDLLTALAAARRDHVSIITTAYNRPFTVDGFSQWLRNAIAEAGLTLDCQPHGLRKATGRRLAEVGATTKEIMSILGHTTLAEAERYTEEADQIGLAEGAVIKLEARTANKPPQAASDRLGNSSDAIQRPRFATSWFQFGARRSSSAVRTILRH